MPAKSLGEASPAASISFIAKEVTGTAISFSVNVCFNDEDMTAPVNVSFTAGVADNSTTATTKLIIAAAKVLDTMISVIALFAHPKGRFIPFFRGKRKERCRSSCGKPGEI